MNFLEQIDDVLLISKEMVDGKGEDNFFCAANACAAIVGVFDGCGGSGSMTYNNFGGNKGAYMASRIVSGAVCDWFNSVQYNGRMNQDEILSGMTAYIDEAYSVCKKYADDNSKIRGSMVRDFPTTLAIAYMQQEKNGIVVHVMWAGDSRVYLFDRYGLSQLTTDDVDNVDAMENLREDGALRNVLSSDGKYRINYKKVLIDHPSLVFAATDGCFGYLTSPMEFEYMILKNIMESKTPEMLEKKLDLNISEYAGDDYTLALVSMFYGDYVNIQRDLYDRMQFLENQYINVINHNHSEEMLNMLWSQYKVNYERYM